MKINFSFVFIGLLVSTTARAADGLERHEIADVINAQTSKVLQCYDNELTKVPALTGKLRLDFSVSLDGKVVAPKIIESTLKNGKVEECVVELSKAWVFPKPSGVKPVHVTYPFVFKKGQPFNS